MHSSNFIVFVAFALLSPASVGCNAKAPVAAGPSLAPDVDATAVLARVAGGRYRADADMMATSSASYPSQAAPSSTVDVYVSAADASDYLAISPDHQGSGGGVKPGALLVREVFDGDGQLAKLTLMVKGPPGYNSAVGDFWFGVTQPDGTPVVDSGEMQMGKLTQCFSCHEGRAGDGWLFGVPLGQRGAHGHGDGGMRGDDDGGAGDAHDGGVHDGGMHGHDGGMHDHDMGGHHHGDMGGGDVCGDFICGASESCSSCASDCHCCGGGDRHGHTHPCH